jgi:phosphoribosylanthranilate isomerase
MALVKICGITNMSDAVAAVEAGADFLGFNFYEGSPRYISPRDAAVIVGEMPENVGCAGVFVKVPDPDAVISIADHTGIDWIQLHGDESPDYCNAFTGRNLIKVVRARPDFQPDDVLGYPVGSIMLDAFRRDAWGGTGHTVDWRLACEVRRIVPRLFLAGGLTVENVAEAIAVVQPFAVDACSGIEKSPGVKDPSAVREFVRRAKEVVKT